MRKTAILALLILFLAGCTNQPSNFVPTPEESVVDSIEEVPEELKTIELPESNDVTTPPEVELATDLNWPVPFAMQAPFSNWDMPYQEMCEEASLILAAKYFKNEPISKQIMDDELTKLREWEETTLGFYTDSTAEEVKFMGEETLGLEIEVSENVTVENIKTQLNNGYLVLAPTAGRELHNPFFKQPGPLYHMLVIRGYNDKNFIVNDVGIGKGEAYQYPFHIVLNAVHDLPVIGGEIFRPYDEDVSEAIKEEEMLTGEKRILIVKGIK